MSKCKWCGLPEATQEIHDALPPGDMGAAYCWADLHGDPDSCDECDTDHLLSRATKAEARVAELEAAIAAWLPETDDGVVAWPGMEVWVLTDSGTIERDLLSKSIYASDYDAYEARECYSTEAAALAAKEKP